MTDTEPFRLSWQLDKVDAGDCALYFGSVPCKVTKCEMQSPLKLLSAQQLHKICSTLSGIR